MFEARCGLKARTRTHEMHEKEGNKTLISLVVLLKNIRKSKNIETKAKSSIGSISFQKMKKITIFLHVAGNTAHMTIAQLVLAPLRKDLQSLEPIKPLSEPRLFFS